MAAMFFLSHKAWQHWRKKNWWIPNKTFKLNDGLLSLTMWDISCNPIRLAFTVMTRWVGCTLTIMMQCLPGEWAASWQSWPGACQVSGLHPDNHDPVLARWVGCTLTIMTQCLPDKWAAPWQPWPSTCQVSELHLTIMMQCLPGELAAPWQLWTSACQMNGLHPDNHDPVLARWVGCTLTIVTQCFLSTIIWMLNLTRIIAFSASQRSTSWWWSCKRVRKEAGDESSVRNPAVVVSLLQLVSLLWLVSTRWLCGPKPSTATTSRSSRTTPVAEPPSFLSSCEATKGHYSGPWRELRPLFWHSVLTFCWWLLLMWENVAVRCFKICSVFHICLCSERTSRSVPGFQYMHNLCRCFWLLTWSLDWVVMVLSLKDCLVVYIRCAE